MKKALKRSLSFLLAITIIFGSAITGLNEVDFDSVFAVKARATSGTTGDCTWSLDGTVLTISCNGKMGEYSSSDIPWDTNITEVVIGNGVTSIGYSAFENCTKLTSITIPDSVTSIDSRAFYNCTSLTSITIPDSVTSIGDATFYNCTSLISINIPDSVTRIGDSVFSGCESLASINIPNGVTRIGSSAFSYCYSLTSITIPEGVTSISEKTFHWCTGLTSINIPNSVTSIGRAAFHNCTSLASINIPDGVTIINESAFRTCTSLTSIAIPNGVTGICRAAFYNCKSLVSIAIPSSVTSIAGGSFDNCINLSDIYYSGSEIDWDNTLIGYNESFANVTIHYGTHVHEYSDWIIDFKATASAPGYKHKECTVCGEVLETATISQLKPATPKVATTNEIGGVQVKWNAVAGATKYVVYRRQGGYNTWVNVGTTTGNTLLDKNVKSGIFYVYSVRAYNSAGKYSDFVSANTNTRKFMATPKLTTIYNHVNGLAIKWNAVAGITKGYRVYRRGAGQTTWTYLGTTKNLYFIDNAVKNKSGEYFRYTVIADGGYHSKFDTTGLYLRRLANPTLTSAVSSKSGITVKWGAVKGTTGYYVYRKTANSTWTRVGTVGGTNNTTFLDKTAKKGVTYTYTVKAVYGATTSAYNTGISCKDKY